METMNALKVAESATEPSITPPRIKDIEAVYRELRGNQAHLPTYKVSLTEEKYTPSEAMAKVKNIATLKQVMMDKDFLERCLNAKIYAFSISPKAIPQELIDVLENLGAGDLSVYFRIDREKKTLTPISESQYNGLNPNERGSLHRTVLKGIRKGGLLYTSCFGGTGWWVDYSAYHVGGGPLPVAFTEPTY